MTVPIMPWDADFRNLPIHKVLIWKARLDDRYQAEVHRMEGTTHLGYLRVWDHDKDTKLIFEKEIILHYGAIFGPDIDDVVTWENEATAFIDNDYTKEEAP